MLLCNKATVHTRCSSNIHNNSSTQDKANMAGFRCIFVALKAVTCPQTQSLHLTDDGCISAKIYNNIWTLLH